jgi:hypothetical protein
MHAHSSRVFYERERERARERERESMHVGVYILCVCSSLLKINAMYVV